MKTKILLPILMVALGGCTWFSKSPEINDYDISKNLQQIEKTINENTAEIDSSTEEIDKNAEEIKTEVVKVEIIVPVENKEEIQPSLNKIKENSQNIIKETSNIKVASTQLSSAKDSLADANKKVEYMKTDFEEIQKQRDNALKERDEAIEAKNSQFKKTLRTISTVSLILTALFGSLFFFTGSKAGIIGAGVCAVVMAVSMFVEAFMVYIMVAGGIILLLLALYLIYNSHLTKKAFKEVVDTVEVAQDKLTPEAREAIFGKNGETGIMDTIQSKITMKKVQEVKKEMPNLWTYAKTHKN